MSTKLPLIDQLKTAIYTMKTYVDTIYSTLVQSVSEAMTELEDAKVDKPNIVLVTVSVAGWVEDSTLSPYPYRYDIAAQGATAADIATVVVSPSHQQTATACGLCATCETAENIISMWAESTPDDEITIAYSLLTGRNEG